LIFTKALPVRLRALWFAASIVSSLWFLYWICYDVLVWNKAVTQVGPANYAGFTVSIALAILGTQLGKLGILEKPMFLPEQTVHKEVTKSQQIPEGERVQIIEQVRQIQPPKEEETTQAPPGSSVPRGCKFYLGYLHTRPESVEIPEECLGCEHVVECLSPTAGTKNEWV
jgi:hypothetical protein